MYKYIYSLFFLSCKIINTLFFLTRIMNILINLKLIRNALIVIKYQKSQWEYYIKQAKPNRRRHYSQYSSNLKYKLTLHILFLYSKAYFQLLCFVWRLCMWIISSISSVLCSKSNQPLPFILTFFLCFSKLVIWSSWWYLLYLFVFVFHFSFFTD